MLVSELLENRVYKARPRKNALLVKSRNRISKKPTNDKRRRDRLKRHQIERNQQSQMKQELIASS